MLSNLTPIKTYASAKIYDVFEINSPEIREAVIAFWRRHNALHGQEAIERSKQLVLIGMNDDGNIIGVTTAYGGSLVQLGIIDKFPFKAFAFARIFIAPNYRVPELFVNMMRLNYTILNRANCSKIVAGMAVVLENRKLVRPGLLRKFERDGYEFVGNCQRGLEVYIKKFS